jgi:hypothetical protein
MASREIRPPYWKAAIIFLGKSNYNFTSYFLTL